MKIVAVMVNGIVRITRAAATLMRLADRWLLDGLGVRSPAALARMLSYPVRLLEWGLVQWYALTMVLSLVGFGTYFVWR